MLDALDTHTVTLTARPLKRHESYAVIPYEDGEYSWEFGCIIEEVSAENFNPDGGSSPAWAVHEIIFGNLEGKEVMTPRLADRFMGSWRGRDGLEWFRDEVEDPANFEVYAENAVTASTFSLWAEIQQVAA